MHLLAAQPGGFSDDEGIVDLAQTPAEIIILSAADSSLAGLAHSVEVLPVEFPSIRLANWMHLLKPAAYDLYEQKVLRHAQCIVVSLLGGESYWPYGVERLKHWACGKPLKGCRTLIMVPGDDTPDAQLFAASTVSQEQAQRVWRYLREAGTHNHEQLFYFLATEILGRSYRWLEPKVLPQCLLYLPGAPIEQNSAVYAEWLDRVKQRHDNTPVCIVLFYRSHLLSGNGTVFDELIGILEAQQLSPLPVAITSLKDAQSVALINELIIQSNAKLIINTTAFSTHRDLAPDLNSAPSFIDTPFAKDIPVLQLIMSGSTAEDWETHSQGLRSRDIAMQVVLPEMDGRVITRALSFKAAEYFSQRSEIAVVRYALHHERARFVALLASNYCRLGAKPNKQKRLALILANYPTKDGRVGNGVGLDTPASTLNILIALQQAGYPLSDIPQSGDDLVQQLLASVSNNPDTLTQLPCQQSIALNEYLHYFKQLPSTSQQKVLQQWGAPQADPKCRNQRLMLSGIRLGETFVGIQPARGFNINLQANYHDPDLIPPHSYLAFYFWLRHCYQVDAVLHIGKHGNLEWLPGKGAALSACCWPDIALGPVPHFYPFIVNDPGEGAQAKRRAQAVIIDHLMPPLARAETYGDLAELETLVDEYYQALGMDERRETWLRQQILEKVRDSQVLEELNQAQQATDKQLLNELDAWLCDIKEAQIRHGLHRLGELPENTKLADTLLALMRLPRGTTIQSQGLLHNLAHDLNLLQDERHFDPLSASATPWTGARPDCLKAIDDSPWRTAADTRERLELVARDLLLQLVNTSASLDGELKNNFPRTYEQLQYIQGVILKALQQSADNEIQLLLSGLEGKFVPPGPSGAPTRGRLDVLPTGRNFYAVDNRSVPSPAAWAIGQRSAQALIERHLQEHGDFPRQLGLSVWGTATMRTGGDDIAQAFALMGIQPVWAPGSQRVVDFEIMPSMLLQRPRVDVTLRVSGFFRDAFANVMKLYDRAVQALADFNEPGDVNCIQKNVQLRMRQLQQQGETADAAKRHASYRVFGSKPGAYGAGLQGLIDERCWKTGEDLAEAYLNWGGYAYSGDRSDDGVPAKQLFAYQLSQLEVVVQNQDNREHDIFDSDDYYQFQGGMSNAVKVLSGDRPTVYHNDHSNPALPKIRTLKEEINRVIRTRVLNPKWIAAMREHGYKGAFEMAASVDYLFAYDATTQLVDDYQYQKITDALVFDVDNLQFMQTHNPNALEEMAERLLEATQRGLWQQPGDYAERLQDLLLHMDAAREQV